MAAAFARREVRERVSALLDEVLTEAGEPGDGDETDGTDESAETEAAAGTDA